MFVFLFTVLFVSASPAQQYTDWKNYSDLKDVNSFSLSGSEFWAATTGGVFAYNFSDQDYKILSKTDGLNGAFISAVTVDNAGKIWFGSSDGKIDVYNPANSTFKSILDIFNSDRTNKRINELRTSGDTILVATDFGISLINSTNHFFYDTYFKFGTLTSNIKVNSTLKDVRIYSCTENGLAVSKLNANNLSAPESWDVYQTGSGLISNNVSRVIKFNELLIAATDKGFSSFDGTSWQPYLTAYNNQPISDVMVNGDSLIILAQNTIRSFFNGVLTDILVSAIPLKKLLYHPQFGLIVATNNGVLNLNGTEQKYLVPNCPPANRFRELVVDNEGTLFSASGKDNGGVGIMQLKNNTWSSYNVVSNPELQTNDYYSAYSAPDNTKYFGNWGRGFAKLKDGVITSYNASNTSLTGIPGDLQFVVITSIKTDSKNNVWVLNYWSAERLTLSMVQPDDTWHHFVVPAELNRIMEQKFNLVIDSYNTKWYSCRDAQREGLLYFNENGTYTNSADDKSGFLTTSNGLNHNTILSLAVDRRGDLLVGTPSGMNIISNTQAALTQANSQFRISSSFLLRQQSINAIVVDPLNQKWVGTNQGLLLVNADGTRLIAAFDSRNSSLLSDQIVSLTMDENTGTIYAATAEGLTSFKTVSIKPAESFSELFVYPSPYILNAENTILTIDGLIRDCDIKILSVSGKLVREFVTPGGRVANWDGRDDFGNFVSSGVYLIVAYDKEGNSVSTTKVAVLRE